MAKKKMTKAQAAAARYEPTANSIAKKKAQEDEKYMREVRRRAQKKAGSSMGFRFILIAILVVAAVAVALFFTISPQTVAGS